MKYLRPLRNMSLNIDSRKRMSAIIRKMTRISQENSMRRTNRSIIRTKLWTNKRNSKSMSMNSF
jgi:hypothetical protein